MLASSRSSLGTLESAGAGSGAGWSTREARQPLHGIEPVLGGEMGVPHGHGQRPVTHQFCHGSDVHASHDQPAGEGVAEAVPRVQIGRRDNGGGGYRRLPFAG